MCLSTVYNKTVSRDTVLLTEIQKIEFRGDELIFTDLMERETRIAGRLLMADLVNGRVVVDTGAGK